MTITATKKQITTDIEVFVTSDGKEFVPDLMGLSKDNIHLRISRARADAEEHESTIQRRQKHAGIVRDLFGDQADEVMEIMDEGGMKVLCRRWLVLKTIHASLEAKRKGEPLPKSPVY